MAGPAAAITGAVATATRADKLSRIMKRACWGGANTNEDPVEPRSSDAAAPNWGEIRLLNDICDDTYKKREGLKPPSPPTNSSAPAVNEDRRRSMQGVGDYVERFVGPPIEIPGIPFMHVVQEIKAPPGATHHASTQKRITIAIRGSSSRQDWLRDLTFGLQPYQQFRGHMMHSGFMDAAVELLPHAMSALSSAGIFGNSGLTVDARGEPGSTAAATADPAGSTAEATAGPSSQRTHVIRLTGHSLGGAVAVLLGVLLKLEGYNVAITATFGQPMVTDREGAEYLRSQAVPLYRFVHKNDVVTSLPPSFFQYRHYGFVHHLAAKQGLSRYCCMGDNTESDSVTAVRLLNGIKAHTTYKSAIIKTKDGLANEVNESLESYKGYFVHKTSPFKALPAKADSIQEGAPVVYLQQPKQSLTKSHYTELLDAAQQDLNDNLDNALKFAESLSKARQPQH